MPDTRYFCMKKPTKITGSIVSVAAALHFPQSTESAPTYFAMPTVSG